MIAYMQKWITTQIMNADPAEGQKEVKRLMQKIYDNFYAENGTMKHLFSYSFNQKKQGEIYHHKYIVDHLRYDGDILFGSIGITSKQMDEMVRERDMVTHEKTKVVPSGPTKVFEYYTYFGIKAEQQQLLVLRNGNMPEDVYNYIAVICFQALEGEPYRFDIETYQEKTIRERISELNKSKIDLRIALDNLELANKPSFRQLRAKASRKGAAYVTMRLDFDTKLDDHVVDNLLDIGEDKDTKRLVVTDTDAPSKEADAIDILKDVMKAKRDVKITKKDLDNVDYVCEKFCEAMRKTTNP